MTSKFIRKYMGIAKQLSMDVNCLSRGIGTIIVNPKINCIISTGYNGQAKDIPHGDSYKFLTEYVYPQLTQKDKNRLKEKYYIKQEDINNIPDNHPINQIYDISGKSVPVFYCDTADDFGDFFNGCGICPRRLLDCKSGERLDLCQCNHSESNAIINAAKAGHSTVDCYMFCWCGIPCVDCTNDIINAQLAAVYCLDDSVNVGKDAYQFWRSEWLFDNSAVKLVKLSQDFLNCKE